MCILQVKSSPTENFKIYSASAGSGKTYQLTKAFLRLILRPGSTQKYRQLLAITFTNKAVAEMKQRILDSLFNFSQETIPKKSRSLFEALHLELGVSPSELKVKAKRTLKELLHNYAFFDVSTIDKFNHRLIRTFAQDLKISQSFEVVLDTALLLEEAVASLLSKTGSDQKLTQVLLDFSLAKIENDKSWNITYDLFEIGKLIFKENHYPYLKFLRDKEIDDFTALQAQLNMQSKAEEQAILDSAHKALTLIDSNGLDISDFYRGYYPKFLKTISAGDFDFNFNAAWKQDFENAQLYKKDAPSKDKIEALRPQFIALFGQMKRAFHRREFLKNCVANLVPLSLLNELSKELKVLQDEKNVLPISDFNTLIANEIKNQPVPFIYERLGERYRHYFIDEFQDTSMMQWQNLIPLVSNALESEDEKGEKGSLLLVGDIKQAIYRWRGGKAEQFLNLLNLKSNPFSVRPNVDLLETNWRSRDEIIRFNNGFFTHIAPKMSNAGYQKIFEDGNVQKFNGAIGGYVELSFVNRPEKNDPVDQHCIKVLELVGKALEKGHNLGDIAILVRDNKKAVVIADFLAQNNMPVISPDSLLLTNNEKILFLIAFLGYLENPSDRGAIYHVLHYLSNETNSHDFIADRIDCFEDFLTNERNLNVRDLQKLSAYDISELLISTFALVDGSDAYLTQFLDEVFEVEQRDGFGVGNVLKYWKVNGHKLAVSAPENLDAIKVMTIHKAKGLEFPVVIFPYADSKIIDYRGEKIWVDVDEDIFSGFKSVLLNFNKSLGEYGRQVSELFHKELEKLQLDAFNVLYVAMTRAVKALFVVSSVPIKNDSTSDSYSVLFKDYLMHLDLWSSSKQVYRFGLFDYEDGKSEPSTDAVAIPYIYTQKYRHDSKVIVDPVPVQNRGQAEAIYLGNLFHRAMAHIETASDIPQALERVKQQNKISLKDEAYLNVKIAAVLQHSKLKHYFTKNAGVHLNEKEILTEEGAVIRPDKIILNDKKAILIDYKTGRKTAEHVQQINHYSQVLKNMGHKVEQQILVYVDQESIQPLFI